MKEYLVTLTAVSLWSSLIGMISPEGDMKKYIRLLCTLCFLCIMAQPLIPLLSEERDFFGEIIQRGEESGEQYEQIYESTLLSGGQSYAESVIEAQLVQRFSLPAEALTVRTTLNTEGETVILAQITVLLRDEAIFADPREITDYVNESFQCPCTVVYD